MSSPKNQNTLFRFVSLRSPELSEKKLQEIRFLFHPYELSKPATVSSKFYKAIAEKPLAQTNWEALTAAASMFIPYHDEIEVMQDLLAVDPTYYTQSQNFARNKNKTLPANYFTTIASLPSLSSDLTIKLWDNLFYQIIVQKSFYVKEIVMEALLMNAMLITVKKYPGDTSMEEMVRKTKISLPVYLFTQEPAAIYDAAKPTDGEDIYLSEALKSTSKRFLAKSMASDFSAAIDEVRKAERQYLKEERQQYQIQKKQYDASNKSIYDNYRKAFTTAKREMCAAPPLTGYDKDDFCNQPDVDFPEVEPFIFVPKITPKDYLAGYLSSATKYTIDSAGLNTEDFTNLKTQLRDKLTRENDTVMTETKFSKKVKIFGDLAITVSESVLRNANFAFNMCVKWMSTSEISPYMTIQMPDETYNVASIKYSIKRWNDTWVDGTTFAAYKEGTTLVISQLGSYDYYDNNDIYTYAIFKGEVTFTNGMVMTFELENFGTECKTGRLIEKAKQENPVSPTTNFIPKGFGFKQLGIADYRKVVQEVCCYDAGEVAHIENIMAREFKERSTEKSTVRETTIFESEETESETLSDTISTQRFEMQSEIAKILQQQQQINAHADVHSIMGNTTLDAGGSFASNLSKEQSNSQAVTQSKEITERATERLLSRIKKETTVKITESFKETNSHIFDNRESGTHVSGVYRFVNAIYKNQIFNYGKRLMYEFMVPEPGKLHYLGQESSNAADASDLTVPIDPRIEHPNPSSINETNYLALAAKYGAEVDSFPEQFIYLSQSFDYSGAVNSVGSKSAVVRVTDERYLPLSGVCTYAGLVYLTTLPGVSFVVGDTSEIKIYPDIEGSFEVELSPYKNEIPFSVSIVNFAGLSASLSVKCEITDDAILNWKKQVFDTILAAYEQQLTIYNQALAERKASGSQILDSNPLFYRQIEQLVLRRNCISYLIDNSSNSPQRFGQDFYLNGTSFTDAQVKLDSTMDQYTSLSKFMEQAFEWNLISYNFYPYYWGAKADWNKLYQYDSNDATFRSFMQAGMARVVVSVKPGFEDAVMHYMAFGQVWNGGEMPVLGDPLYLSIVDELRQPEYTIEETWETVLPTNLVALQNSGVALDAKGLPCGDDCKEALANNQFKESKTILGFPKVKDETPQA